MVDLKLNMRGRKKNNIKQIIESKIDNKGQYAYDKCIEENI